MVKVIMLVFELLLGGLIAANIIGGLVFFCGVTDGLDWEELFNPFVIFQKNKVNWFGAWLIAAVSFICMMPFALCFYIYKLCTIGRKDI